MNETKRKSKGWVWDLGKKQRWRFGAEYSPVFGVGEDTSLYLERWILYLGRINLRLHRFWRGDDDRAPHDHPFAFITFPFTSYVERVPVTDEVFGSVLYGRIVRRWRFHYRPATFQHFVVGRLAQSTKPFWTFVIAGPYEREWGFWPNRDTFIPWKKWK